MIGLDANCLTRLFVDDPESMQQCREIRAVVGEAGGFFVPTVALVEMAWVLNTVYKFADSKVRELIEAMLAMPGVLWQDRPLVESALGARGVGLADGLILAAAKTRGARLLTFDKKLARLSGAESPAAAAKKRKTR